MTEQIKEWLVDSYDYEPPKRGQIREGVILKVGERGVTVDVGLKRDGFVPDADVERLEEEVDALQLEPGQEVTTRIVRPVDREGKLVLSLYQALSEQDWDRAEEMLANGKVWQGTVTDYNRGGLIAKYGRLRGFVPGSHLWAPGRRHLAREKRKQVFQTYVGRELSFKVIEVDRENGRLILSERLAQRQLRQRNMERLLNELIEGQVVQGTVQRLADFGAFVDLGGASGLVHISELSWHHAQHPGEVVSVGDEIKVYVLRLDHKRQRIALSLKRLRPSPWDLVDTTYAQDQLVRGTVTSVVNFGAFVALDVGVEGLVHISELADPPPEDPRAMVQPDDEFVLRILHIDSIRHRIGLSLKRVSAREREEWLAQQASDASAGQEGDGALSSPSAPASEGVEAREEMAPGYSSGSRGEQKNSVLSSETTLIEKR